MLASLIEKVRRYLLSDISPSGERLVRPEDVPTDDEWKKWTDVRNQNADAEQQAFRGRSQLPSAFGRRADASGLAVFARDVASRAADKGFGMDDPRQLMSGRDMNQRRRRVNSRKTASKGRKGKKAVTKRRR